MRAERERHAAAVLAVTAAAGEFALHGAWSELFSVATTRAHHEWTTSRSLQRWAVYIFAARRVDQPAAALVVPYLAWVSFAALRNEEIVRLNH